MSRSKLRSKYMRFRYIDDSARNVHKRDEMPKNRPSKLVSIHGGNFIDWLQDSTSFGGHSRPKGGHRRVSGLVRASLRKETRKLILEQLQEDV